MSKATKFDEFLSSNNINCFSKEEIDNEMHSIVYRAHMDDDRAGRQYLYDDPGARCRWRC